MVEKAELDRYEPFPENEIVARKHAYSASSG
jgi:hypothetical protein